jgi:hypothetical protein
MLFNLLDSTSTTNISGATTQWNTGLVALNELGGKLWLYFALAALAFVVVWGIGIAIRYIMASKQEEQIQAKSLIKQLVIGVIIAAVIAVIVPLFIKGLIVWTGSDIPALS